MTNVLVEPHKLSCSAMYIYMKSIQSKVNCIYMFTGLFHKDFPSQCEQRVTCSQELREILCEQKFCEQVQNNFGF